MENQEESKDIVQIEDGIPRPEEGELVQDQEGEPEEPWKESYGVLVSGPSGSGKSTCCNALSQFFKAVNRKHIIVNLDPANENLCYAPDIDIQELILLDDVMKEVNLGYEKNKNPSFPPLIFKF